MDNPINDFSEVKLGILKSVEFVTSILLIAAVCLTIITIGNTIHTHATSDAPVTMENIAGCVIVSLMVIVIDLIRQSVGKNIISLEQQLSKGTGS